MTLLVKVNALNSLGLVLHFVEAVAPTWRRHNVDGIHDTNREQNPETKQSVFTQQVHPVYSTQIMTFK